MAVMRPILTLLLLTFALGLRAEVAYVDDTLRVLVRSEPDSRKNPVTTIVSGDRVEILERKGEDDVKIRTADDEEGWVKERYLTTEVPPRAQLGMLQEQHTQLQAELAKAKADKQRLGETAASQLAELEALRTQLALVGRERDTLVHASQAKEQGKEEELRNIVLAIAGALLFLFTLGYVLGVRKVRRQVRERFGGMEV